MRPWRANLRESDLHHPTARRRRRRALPRTAAEGLRAHPEAFGASWEEEAGEPVPWFAERLERNAVWGGWLGGDPALAGAAGLLVPEAAKLRHKGVLWGMFARPEARGAGLAEALARRVLEEAAGAVEEVRLTVVASNAAAVRLYARLGFREYGREPRALKVGAEYDDELLMALRLPDHMRAVEPGSEAG